VFALIVARGSPQLGEIEQPSMTLESFVFFALGCFVGSVTVIGVLVFAGLRSKRKRGRRSSQRRTVANTA
jgi:hypothetical protein